MSMDLEVGCNLRSAGGGGIGSGARGVTGDRVTVIRFRRVNSFQRQPVVVQPSPLLSALSVKFLQSDMPQT